MRYSYSKENEGSSPWFSFQPRDQWKLCLLVSLLILAASIGFFVWCTRVSNDLGGDSFAGLVFAVGCTVFLFLAAVSFTLQRRARKRVVGKLNAVLNWHICFGVIALVMVFLHAFGNLNPRTGTYALYGMIALVISGAVGRILDRMAPRMIVQEMSKVLTIQGEDRLESTLRKLRADEEQRKQGLPAFRASPGVTSSVLSSTSGASGGQSVFPGLWDLGYNSLETLSPQTSQWDSMSGRSGALSLDGRGLVGAVEKEVSQAFKRERFLRYLLRYWRIFHIVLAVVTVGLTLWHIEYALSLVIPALQKFGFGYLLPWP